MKLVCCLLSVLVALVVAVWVEVPSAYAGGPGNIMLEVKSASTTSGAKTTFQSKIGSYDTSFDRERTVEITLRSLGVDQPRSIDVQIWWIGQLSGTSTRVVLHKSTVAKSVSNNTPQTWQEMSPEVKGRDMNLRGIHRRNQTGARIIGWIVQADGDNYHAVEASEASLRDLAGSQALKNMEKAAGN